MNFRSYGLVALFIQDKLHPLTVFLLLTINLLKYCHHISYVDLEKPESLQDGNGSSAGVDLCGFVHIVDIW